MEANRNSIKAMVASHKTKDMVASHKTKAMVVSRSLATTSNSRRMGDNLLGTLKVASR